MIASKQANFISNHQKNHINHQENQRQKENLKDSEQNINKLPIGNQNNNNNQPNNNNNNRWKQSADQEADHISRQLRQQNAIETTSETKTKATQQTVMQTKKQHQQQSGTSGGAPKRPADARGQPSDAKLSSESSTAVAGTATPTTAANATSLTTTSVKIQQRQQKFLAAAAKSHLKRPSSGNSNESAWRTPLLPLLARVNESRFSDKSPLNQAAAAAAMATSAAPHVVIAKTVEPITPATPAKSANCYQPRQQQKSATSVDQEASSSSVSPVGGEPSLAPIESTMVVDKEEGAGCDLPSQQLQTLPSDVSKLSARAGASRSPTTSGNDDGDGDNADSRIVGEGGDACGGDKMRVSAADSSAPVAFQGETATSSSQFSGNDSRESPASVESDLQRQQRQQHHQHQHQQQQQQQQQHQQYLGVRRAGEKDKPVRKDTNNHQIQVQQKQSPSVGQQETSQQASNYKHNSSNNLLASADLLLTTNRPQEQQKQQQQQPQVDNETNSDSNYSSSDNNYKPRNLNHNPHQQKTNGKPSINNNCSTTKVTAPSANKSHHRQQDNIQQNPYQKVTAPAADLNHSNDNTCAKSINKPSATTSTTLTTKQQQQREVYLTNPKQQSTLPNVNKNVNELAISNLNYSGANQSIASCGPSSTGGSAKLNHQQQQQQPPPPQSSSSHYQGTTHQRQQFYNNINILCSNHNNYTNNNNSNNTNIINNSANHYNHLHNNFQHHHHQQQQPQHQNAMAHYKFHNDCQSSVLTYEQVKRLDFVMDQTVPIHGRGNSPTLFVKLKELIRLVKHKLQHEHSIDIRDVRLNGGAASYVLAPENSHYNDLDLIFGTDLSDEDRFDVIRDVVLECLKEFAPNKTPAPVSTTTTTTTTTAMTTNKTTSEASDGYNINESGTDDDLTELSRSNRSLSLESDSMNITLANNCSEDATTDDDNASSCDDDKSSNGGHVSSGQVSGQACDDFKSKRQVYEEKSMWKTKNNEVGSTGGSQENNSNSVSSLATDHKLKGDGRSHTAGVCSALNQSTRVCMNSATNEFVVDPLQPVNYQMPLSNCAIKEAYVHKMVKVNDDDRWSLISLGVQQSEANCCNQQQVQQQQRLLIQQQQECGQMQSPNSIELKFVDRMRRKFEFSVDSFQIILDSLISFYDYVPQSTITIQRKLACPHPSSGMVKPVMCSGHRQQIGCCSHSDKHSFDCNSRDEGQDNDEDDQDNENFHDHETYEKNSQGDYQNMSNFFGAGQHGSSNNNSEHHTHHRRHNNNNHRCSQSYYQLPTSSPSNSSVASSSGCSSSSSVVSSSSSSLSYDEDQEDLYGDTDSTPSSSASTSSLLSSTTLSMMSSSPPSSSSASPSGVPAIKTSSHQQQLQKGLKSSKGPAVVSSNDVTTCCSVANSFGKSTQNTSGINLVNVCLADCADHHNLNKSSKSSGAGKHCKSSASLVVKQQASGLINCKNVCDFERSVGKAPSSSSASCAVISENFYPTVIGRSEYGNFKEAMYHLEKKLIATRSPEEIRGGGLLKYCNLLVKNYKPTNVYQIRTLERYMCSRFFIDFSDLNQQRAKLESYLANHFSDDPIQKFDYLTILHNVVHRSTVCLMNHELRLTLNMIRELAYKLNEQQQAQQQQQQQQQQDLEQQHQQQISSFQQQPVEQTKQHYYQQQEPIVMQSGAKAAGVEHKPVADAVLREANEHEKVTCAKASN